MRNFILIALTPFLLAASHKDKPGLPPGVPEKCCGYTNCRQARIEIIERGRSRDVVVVDGKRLVLPAGMVVQSNRSSSWWCYQEILDGCEREVSERCARCAVKGEAPVAEIRMIPVPARGRGGHLLLPSGGCAKCHISGASFGAARRPAHTPTAVP